VSWGLVPEPGGWEGEEKEKEEGEGRGGGGLQSPSDVLLLLERGSDGGLAAPGQPAPKGG